MVKNEKKKTWIADKLCRDYSVIKREIKRNSGEYTPYVAMSAQHYSERRKSKTNIRKLDKYGNEKLKKYVIDGLELGWSPEETSGRLEECPPEWLNTCKDTCISYESIYDWIYNGGGRFGGLYKKLRRKQKKRKRQFSRKQRAFKEKIKDRVSIDERPGVVDRRERIGDWETDSVIFKDKSILSVQYERRSMLVRIHKCFDKSAIRSEETLRDSIESLPKNFWLSITRDNGLENVLHHETEVDSYFCDKYCSWQKGGVENINGLFREYFPKRSYLDSISNRYIYEIQEKLNDVPRKKFNYLTPNEVIAAELEKGALNS